MRRPIDSVWKSAAEPLITPEVSTANGWKRYDCDKTEYLLLDFLLAGMVAANSSGVPVTWANDKIWQYVKILTAVTSRV